MTKVSSLESHSKQHHDNSSITVKAPLHHHVTAISAACTIFKLALQRTSAKHTQHSTTATPVRRYSGKKLRRTKKQGRKCRNRVASAASFLYTCGQQYRSYLTLTSLRWPMHSVETGKANIHFFIFRKSMG